MRSGCTCVSRSAIGVAPVYRCDHARRLLTMDAKEEAAVDFRSISVQEFSRYFAARNPDPRDDGPHRRSNSEYRISLCNEQATYTVIAREYSSTTQLTRRFGICFRPTNYHSDRCARLCKCRNASFPKRDYGQRDGDYRQHDFGVDIHIALPFLAS